MKMHSYKTIEAKEADEGAKKLKVRWLITKEMGAPNVAMRLFEMEPGGNSPLHKHPWEHEVFILEGKATVVGEQGEKTGTHGDAVFIPPNEMHQFKNNDKSTLKFLCLVPIRE